jgi:hypothetical protein
MQLGHFSANRDAAISKGILDADQRLRYAMRRIKENDRHGGDAVGFKFGANAGLFLGKKA